MARRVAETNAWREEGERSPAHFLARATGRSVSSAVGMIETARRMADLPRTEAAFRKGALSGSQAEEIASAAGESPSSEEDLLTVAERVGTAGLRQACQRVKAAASPDEEGRYEALHRSRSLRTWTDRDRAFRLGARLTPDAGARALSALEPFKDAVFSEARRQGRWEPYDAYAADALVAMAEAARSGSDAPPSGPRAMVHVRVDHAALVRGRLEEGETCEIPGVGPVPGSTARAFFGDALLSVIVTKGADVASVTHHGRTIPAVLRTALVERDGECVVPGCHVRHHLEIDHMVPFSLPRQSVLSELCLLCSWHHHLKTHRGYRIEGGPGHWRWIAPDRSPRSVADASSDPDSPTTLADAPSNPDSPTTLEQLRLALAEAVRKTSAGWP